MGVTAAGWEWLVQDMAPAHQGTAYMRLCD
jgi:hypothetical protein